MKKIYTLISAMLLGVGVFAQCTVTITGSTNVTCNGLCDGSATVTTVGLPSFSYSWSPGGQTVQNPSNLCAGTNTVTMTDGNSCVSTASITITEPTILQDSTTQTNISSCDSCNGTATVYPYGGTAPVTGYTHKWSTTPIQTTATATGLCPGTYTDTITDANNCQTIATVTITQAAALSVFINVINASSPTACDGGATASPSGGNAPYTYQWSPGGETVPSIIAQCPDTLTLCVTDADGCSICDSNVVISFSTGLSDLSFANGIHVSPNPSLGQFTIVVEKLISNTSISIINILGKQVYYSTLVNQKTEIDLYNQPKGIYFIQINTDKVTALKKVIIQ